MRRAVLMVAVLASLCGCLGGGSGSTSGSSGGGCTTCVKLSDCSADANACVNGCCTFVQSTTGSSASGNSASGGSGGTTG